MTCAPAFDAAVLAAVDAAFDTDTELVVLASAAVVEALLSVVVEAAAVAVDVDVDAEAEAEADVCELVDSSAALATAGKGGGGDRLSRRPDRDAEVADLAVLDIVYPAVDEDVGERTALGAALGGVRHVCGGGGERGEVLCEGQRVY